MTGRVMLTAVLAMFAMFAGGSVLAGQGEAREAMAAISAWDIERASAIAKTIGAGGADPLDAAYINALCAFHTGDFKKAWALLADLNVAAEPVERLKTLAGGSKTVTDGYVSEVSPGGHFRFRYPPGPAGVLVRPAMEALERQRSALGALWGFAPPEVITVDIVSSAADLAAMTGLKETEISDTGTVAVCKYNRIMLTTPEALINGYPYLDTLGHEYVHYLVSRMSADRVEVWLQEAIAKTYESAWRSGIKSLRPDQEGALSAAVSSGQLIPFSKMSPSLAKLPDGEAAALAFSEVYSVLEFLRSTKGDGVAGAMVKAAAVGGMAGAIHTAGYKTLPDLESAWRTWAKKRYAGVGAIASMLYKNRYKNGDAAGEKMTSAGESGDPAAGRFLRLGDILMARGKTDAALKEYEKALIRASHPNPVISNRLAVAYLADGQPQKAMDSLKSVEALYPDYLSTLMNGARAAMKLQKNSEAAAFLKRAAEVNPFDPEVWNRTATVSEALGDRNMYDAAKNNQWLISKQPKSRVE